MSAAPVAPFISINKETPTIPGPEPVPYFSHVGHGGKDALWIGFVIFLCSTMVIAVMASRLDKKYRVFHFITMLITGIAALSYYAMAVGSGYAYIYVGKQVVQGQTTSVIRQVFWAREVEWAFTTPLLLLTLSLLAGMPWLEIISLLILGEGLSATSLFTALHPGPQGGKWGWFTFSCLFLLGILYMLLWTGRKYAQDRHQSLCQLYLQLSVYTILLWLISLIIFAIGAGAGHLSPDAEAITHTILDLLTKIGFSIWLLVMHKHDSEEECAVMLSESCTEPWGAKTGVLQLPEGED